MANTVNLLSYANTFGDQLVTINALAQENNNMAANNYIKPTGTLYLNDPTLGLQVANNAVVAGQLQVQGTGSSAYIQNNLRVDTQVYFTNTVLGLTNSGQANINGLLVAQGPGTGLYVANTANVGGTFNVVGATALGNTLTVTGATTLGNTLTVSQSVTVAGNVTAQNYVNVTQDVNAHNFNATGLLNSYGLNVTGSGSFTGQVSVGGNFVINGTTVYSTNTFTLNAGSGVGLTSYFSVNRGASANAQIRWNEPSQYWDIRDVNNPTSYSQILTANLISDSLTSTSSSPYIASQKAANTLYTYLTSNVATLNTTLNSNITANVVYLQGVQTTQNASSLAINNYANSAYAQANATNTYATSSYAQANASNSLATSAYGQANATNQYATSSYGQANASNSLATSAYGQANTVTANLSANVAYFQGIGNTQNTNITAVNTYATSAYNQANATNQYATTSYAQANASNSLAQSAYNTANNRVSSITGTLNQVIVSGTLTPTLSLPQNIDSGASVQHGSLGIGTAASGTSGEIRATNNITAYYSDDRLKTRLGNIENALAKVMSLNGFQYEANETAQALGYAVKPEIGLSAQEVQAVLPEVVVPAPIDDKYLTIHYERVIPLLVEAIKELKAEIDELKKS